MNTSVAYYESLNQVDSLHGQHMSTHLLGWPLVASATPAGLWLLQQPHKLSYTLWFNLAFTLNQPIISFYLIVGGALQSSAQPHEKALQNASSTSKGHNPLWFLVATMGDANKV